MPMAKHSKVVGTCTITHDITVGREPEVGVGWLAECDGRGASARTPRAAVYSLIKVLNADGFDGAKTISDEALDSLGES
jgi:hypothetical protein